MAPFNMNSTTLRLMLLSFFEFGVWGTYLTSVGIYLFNVGLGGKIGWFFAVQGIASIFMPAIMGGIADKWVPAQRLLALCHAVAAIFMAAVGYIGMTKGADVAFAELFVPYALGVAFFMPTIALSNSVSFTVLGNEGKDAVRIFPRIRVLGTVGFIVAMWTTDLLGFKDSYNQFFASAALGVIMALYSLTMPACPPKGARKENTLFARMGGDAFAMLADRRMALFFLFAILLGAALQISNGYTGAYLGSFASVPGYEDTFAVKHPVIMTSLSQMSETFCILLIPFFLKHYGIKRVILIAMLAWSARFLLLGAGNPAGGAWMFVLSMVVYGVAFDFFNISGSLYVNSCVDEKRRSGAQGLFMLATNGLGASIGMIAAQMVVNYSLSAGGWVAAWYIFAAYAAVVALLFLLCFKEK